MNRPAENCSVTVILTGAHSVTACDSARSLRAYVNKIIAIGIPEARNSPISRLVDEYVAIKSVEREIVGQLQGIAARSAENRMVLLPCDDESVYFLSERRDEVSQAIRLLLPPRETVRRLLDKAEFYRFAKQAGFLMPEQRTIGTKEELDEALQQLKFPVLIKPLFRNARWEAEFGVDKVLCLDSPESSEPRVSRAREVSPNLVIQELVPGTERDIFFMLALYDEGGRVVASCAGQKILQWPPDFGSTAVAVSDAPTAVSEIGERFLSKAGLIGLGSIEMKRSNRDGGFYLIEPTVGRNDHQSYLATATNCNLTLAAVNIAVGRPAGIARPKSRAVWVDTVGAIRSLRYSRFAGLSHVLRSLWFRKISLARGLRGTAREVGSLLRNWCGRKLGKFREA